MSVAEGGLVVSEEHPFLATSTDGFVTEDGVSEKGVLEIKCPVTRKTVTDLAASKKKKFLVVGSGGSLKLRESHPYFTQIQFEMAVSGCSWAESCRPIEEVTTHCHDVDRADSSSVPNDIGTIVKEGMTAAEIGQAVDLLDVARKNGLIFEHDAAPVELPSRKFPWLSAEVQCRLADKVFLVEIQHCFGWSVLWSLCCNAEC